MEEARLVEFQLQSLVQSIFLPSTPCSERKEEKHTEFFKRLSVNVPVVMVFVCVCVFGALREREREKMSRCEYYAGNL